MATFSYRSCLFDIFQGRENYRGWDCCSWVHLHIGRVRDKIMLNVFGLFGNTDRSCKYGRKARKRGKSLPKWSKWSGTKLRRQLLTSRHTCWLATLMCRWTSFDVWGGLIRKWSFSHLYFLTEIDQITIYPIIGVPIQARLQQEIDDCLVNFAN